MMHLDAEMVERFRRDGFLSFDTGISAAEIAAMRNTLLALHEKKVGFKEGALFDAIGIDDGTTPAKFPQILHPRSFAGELIDNSFFRLASSIAQQLLGGDVRFKADISLMKPALIGSTTPWHQDEAFQDPAFDYEEISFWLALQPVDEANSCMAYVPGSHKGPVLPHGFPGGDQRVHALECVDGFNPQDAIVCPLPAGGCVIHTGRTVHGAGPNVSGQDRMAYALLFDKVPVPARALREFSWRGQHRTARAEREREWRRNGGLLVHLWRQRSRVRVTNPKTLFFDIHRAVKAVRRLMIAG